MDDQLRSGAKSADGKDIVDTKKIPTDTIDISGTGGSGSNSNDDAGAPAQTS